MSSSQNSVPILEGPPHLVRESTEAFEASETTSFGASPPKNEASGFARSSEASEASSFGASPPKNEASGFARRSEASEASSFGASPPKNEVASPGALKQV